MKKTLLALFAMLVATPVMATEPTDLSSLGLSDIQVVSEDAGMQVRGLSSNAYSSGLSTVRAFAIDVATGATFNANASNFSSGSQDGVTTATSTAGASTFAGFNGLTFTTGLTALATLEGAGASSGLSGGGGFDFATAGATTPAPTFGFTAAGFNFGNAP